MAEESQDSPAETKPKTNQNDRFDRLPKKELKEEIVQTPTSEYEAMADAMIASGYPKFDMDSVCAMFGTSTVPRELQTILDEKIKARGDQETNVVADKANDLLQNMRSFLETRQAPAAQASEDSANLEEDHADKEPPGSGTVPSEKKA